VLLTILGAPFFILFLAAVAGPIMQHIPVISMEPVKPQMSRISPLAGLKRMFGKEALVNFAKSLGKLVIVSVAVFMVLWPDRAKLDSFVRMDVGNILVASRDEAFAELLHNNSQFYVSHWAPSPVEAIKAIAAAGGVSILAHPFAEKRGAVLTFGEVTELAAAGLNGIERNKRDQDEAAHSKIDQLSSEHNLIKVGSSDYHGSARANQLGEEQTPLDLWENLASKASVDEVFTRLMHGPLAYKYL
jgi:hypothetical protein